MTFGDHMYVNHAARPIKVLHQHFPQQKLFHLMPLHLDSNSAILTSRSLNGIWEQYQHQGISVGKRRKSPRISVWHLILSIRTMATRPFPRGTPARAVGDDTLRYHSDVTKCTLPLLIRTKFAIRNHRDKVVTAAGQYVFDKVSIIFFLVYA